MVHSMWIECHNTEQGRTSWTRHKNLKLIWCWVTKSFIDSKRKQKIQCCKCIFCTTFIFIFIFILPFSVNLSDLVVFSNIFLIKKLPISYQQQSLAWDIKISFVLELQGTYFFILFVVLMLFYCPWQKLCLFCLFRLFEMLRQKSDISVFLLDIDKRLVCCYRIFSLIFNYTLRSLTLNEQIFTRLENQLYA